MQWASRSNEFKQRQVPKPFGTPGIFRIFRVTGAAVGFVITE
jgi:hypothetical protein